MTDFDEKARMMQDALEAARQQVSWLSEFFSSCLDSGFTRAEALALTRDQFRYIQDSGGSDE